MDTATLKMFLAQQQEANKEQLLFLQQQQEKLLETILKKIGTQSDHTNTINSLNGRISTFIYNSEDGETFDRWYGRYEDVIKVDGAQLDDASKARFLVTKLEKHEAEQFRNHILPKMPAEVNFDETVAMLRKLFNETKSITRLRYELLSVKFDGYDRKIYTGLSSIVRRPIHHINNVCYCYENPDDCTTCSEDTSRSDRSDLEDDLELLVSRVDAEKTVMSENIETLDNCTNELEICKLLVEKCKVEVANVERLHTNSLVLKFFLIGF
uniref:DUF7083 domain-containing protein n=1 Tax=Caenorhabditis japonica TaxID=281687 RepID=A0A8R1EI06_CAEJA